MTSKWGAIPDWDYRGLLPAIDEESPTSPERSPYSATLLDLVIRFGTSRERRNLLRGLINFRDALHKAGLTHGFQWVNGSFVENVEVNGPRSPNDIDLVTFFQMPEGLTEETLFNSFPSLFDSEETRNLYSVDAYFVPINRVYAEEDVERSIYWYGLWSHKRVTFEWKGFLRIDLGGVDDSEALAELERLDNEGGQQ